MSYCRFSTRCKKGYSDIYAWDEGDAFGMMIADDINLPLAGKVFKYKKLKNLLKRILELKELGYNVSITAINDIKKEINHEHTSI